MNTRVLDGEIITTRLDDVRAYEGVLTRRVVAFCIDYLLIGLLMIPFAILVFFVGIITLGLGWALFGVLFPLVAIIYVWNTLGGRNQATTGMRMMGIRARPHRRKTGRWHARRCAHGAVLGRQCGADAADPACLALHRPQAHHP